MTETNYSEPDIVNDNQDPTTELPEFIGDYEILEKLGEGGFAMVYLARDKSASRADPVALKVLIAPESYRRFLREVETIAKLDHPNIVRIFDSGKDDKIVTSHGSIFKKAEESAANTARNSGTIGKIWSRLRGKTVDFEAEMGDDQSATELPELAVPYFTMEYIPGGTLRDKLDAQSKLSIDEALNITKQIGSALTYAHEKNIIHRDVNPNNILLDNRQEVPTPVLTDFG
ncbi:MAG: serine/threonine-protein kinase, partial [Anaerolineae bacterium]|nr:serine/threonine-protein kinase [Anaerolineae bacterium]